MMGAQKMYVTPATGPDGLNLREGQGQGFPVVVTVVPDAMLTVLQNAGEVGKRGKWVRVRTAEGEVGFAAAWLLERAEEDGVESPGQEVFPPVAVYPDWPPQRGISAVRRLLVDGPVDGAADGTRTWAEGAEFSTGLIVLHIASVDDLRAVLRDDADIVTLDL